MSDSLMTPSHVFEAIKSAQRSTPGLDPCWHPASPVVADRRICNFETGNPEDHIGDGLAADWTAMCPVSSWIWLNPPYSRGQVGKWLAKARESGRTVWTLLRFDPTTKWFRDHMQWLQSTEGPSQWIHGVCTERLRYGRVDGGPQMGARFTSYLLGWRGQGEDTFNALRPSMAMLPAVWFR